MKAPFLIMLVVIISACQSSNTNSVKDVDTLSTVVGNDVDSSGCLTSAGFIWSQTKKTCIQPWNEGIKLHNVNSSASFQKAAYIVIDSTSKQAEIFMAENNIILSQIAPDIYSNGSFNLAKEDHCWTIRFNNTQLYQEPTM